MINRNQYAGMRCVLHEVRRFLLKRTKPGSLPLAVTTNLLGLIDHFNNQNFVDLKNNEDLELVLIYHIYKPARDMARRDEVEIPLLQEAIELYEQERYVRSNPQQS